MNSSELVKKLAAHKEWLFDNECGEKLCLSGADLRKADLCVVNLSGADLSGADLSGADLRGVNLSGADLRGVNLSGADLNRADLRGADLRYADLRRADLHWADLSDSDLSDSNLRGADLRGVNLSGTKGLVLLPVQDPRGHAFAHAVLCDDGWRVRVGCRDFTIDEALAHWGHEYRGNREQGDMYLFAVNWLKAKLEGSDNG